MVIEFLCPRGHKIRCREERAGQAARCPKCGVKFIIPDASESPAPENVAAGPSGSGSGGSGVRAGAGASKDLIEFLCPNGHLLHGSKRLQGHPGQCPECGSKFRIPTYEDIPSEEGSGDKKPQDAATPQQEKVEPPAKEPDAQATLEPLEAREDSAINLSDVHGAFDEPRVARAGEKLRTALQTNGSGRLPRAKEPHPFFDAFCRLWATKADAAVVEVRLANGETLNPWRFSKGMSQGSHAVFAVKEPDETFTLVAVAWDSISQVFVRRVQELPEELRDQAS